MRPRFKPRRALPLVLPFAMAFAPAFAPAFALAFGQEDDCGPVSEVDVFHPDWVDLWNDATNREVKGAPVGSPAMMHTPPDGIPRDRLRYLVAIREAHEYLGSPGPDAERRTWCDVCPGDYDQDGRIGGADLATLLLNWGSGNLCLTLDRTDPIVDGNDLALLLANWNRFCEWPLDWRPEDCGD